MQTINRPKPFQNGKGPSRDGGGPLSSKGGTILAALLAAGLAAAAIVLFINQYKDNVDNGSVPTPAIVASKLIEKGASGDTVAAQKLFSSTNVPHDQLKDGAISDPAKLKGQVATTDILPGQQLTTDDFEPAGSGVITKLAPTQRAMAIPLDGAHGLVGTLRVGDHVDILAGFGTRIPITAGITRIVVQDALVLKVPTTAKSGASAIDGGANAIDSVTVRLNSSATSKVALAAEYGKVWLALRPADGKDLPRRSLATIEALMFSDLANARTQRSRVLGGGAGR